ncbi:FtsK/SpoIIIE domain-containing protein [Thalassiella azotivora]
MQIRVTVVDAVRRAARADVVLTVGPDVPATELRSLLLASVGRDPDDPVDVHVAGRPLDDGVAPGDPPFVQGALVTVGRRGPDPARARRSGGFLELHVVGGPDAGQVHRLGPGEHPVGRAGRRGLVVDDPDVSRRHATLLVDADGVRVRDEDSTNGTWVDGRRLGPGAVRLDLSSRVLVGSSTLALRLPDADAAAVQPAGDGTLLVNRAPRLRQAPQAVEVRFPAPPTAPRTVRVPVVALVLPVVVAVPLALLWSPMALLFGLMSPVMLLGNALSDRVTGRREHRRATAEHATSVSACRTRVRDALAAEQVRRRTAAPDPALVRSTVSTPLHRLWERRREDEDLLALGVGTASLPSDVRVVDPAVDDGAPQRPAVDDVPVTVDLPRVGVLGVTGPRHRRTALGRWLLAQAAATHSPRDLAVVVLADPQGPDDRGAGPGGAGAAWEPAGWLPHCRPEHLSPGLADAAGALVGTTADQVRRRVAELVGVLDARLEAATAGLVGRRSWAGPRVLVLLDGARRLRAVPGVPRLLAEGPAVGIHLLCLEEGSAGLPVECGATVTVHGEVATRLRLAVAGEPPVDDVVADLVSHHWFEGVCRLLAPLRDATPEADRHEVPDSARLLEVLHGLERPDPTDPGAVARSWRARPRSTCAVLGVGADGPHEVDLRRDGPHVLVAGTTGSGKSELLQTLIASLATVNRPDEMGFVLVDYKGGSAFAECARLPHVLGLVTDLDEDLTRRALTSLTAEVTRRERLLARHAAKDLDDYLATRDRATSLGVPADGPDAVPALGRLVIVIDEFRVLAEELPGFIDGLVRIAAVGRSLGVHLVLATQRPAGVVGADIKANVNLRIALRVRDDADSVDVVDSPRAAATSERTPGRALLRTGSGPLTEVQTARVGGRPPQAARTLPSWRRAGWPVLGDPPPPPGPPLPGDGPTDLQRVVAAVREASAVLGVQPPASPWLPPLPATLPLDSVRGTPPEHSGAEQDAGRRGPSEPVRLTFGLLDDPARQRQVPARLDLGSPQCLGVAGTARSGRTTLLRTLAVSAARAPAGQVAVYVLDGGGALTGLAALPVVGAVVPRDDPERVARLLRRLDAEVTRRQQQLSAGGWSDLAEWRRDASDGSAPPYVLLLVDGYDSLQQALEDQDAGRALDGLMPVLRQGPGAGVLTVVCGERSVLSGPLAAGLGTKLVLRTADPTDVVLAGVPPREAPRELPPGRGVLVDGHGWHVVQVAVPGDDASGSAQAAALEGAARTTAAAAVLPFRVDALPGDVTESDLLAHPGAAHLPGWLVLGLGGDDVAPTGWDLGRDGRRFLVAGHPRSGRTTTLLRAVRALLADDRPVVLVAPRPSALEQLGAPVAPQAPQAPQAPAQADLPGTSTCPDTGPTGVLGVLRVGDAHRLDALLDAAARGGTPAAVVVDDADAVDGTDLEGALLRLLDRSATSGEVVVAAASTPALAGRFGGFCVQLRRGAGGLLLGPLSPLDGDVLGIRVGRRAERRPGRGLLVTTGEPVLVQVARPTDDGAPVAATPPGVGPGGTAATVGCSEDQPADLGSRP